MRLMAIPLLALLAAPLAPAAHADPLVLNEILAGPARDWDGSGTFSSRDDEWVEVMNTSAAALDLTGYVITDGDSLPRYALSGTLAAGEVLLVTGKMSFDWEHATGNAAFGLSLGNSGDQVILWKVTGPDTVAVDSYTYKSHEAAADRAIGRSPNGTGGWALFDALNPYTGATTPTGTGCAPTPGTANTCGSTPTRGITWGEVKTLYRDGKR
jgi:Lamin Tail Domain